MFRAEVTVVEAVSTEFSSRSRGVDRTFINESTCKASNWLGARSSWTVVTKWTFELITIAKDVSKASNVAVISTKAHLTVIDTTLVVGRLESAFRAVGRLLTSNGAVSTGWASLWDSAVVVAILAWLADSALTDLLCGSRIREGTDRAQNWRFGTFTAVVSKRARECLINDIRSVNIGLSVANVSRGAVVDDSRGGAELGGRARNAVIVSSDADFTSGQVVTTGACLCKGIFDSLGLNANLVLWALSLCTGLAQVARWALVTE